ncbi:PEP-CTERM sorting domain-containing protein [Fimbriiglobus ruber]|uniref:Ice-binding protein C-terminal domain-containing protein n=1 Tax=Fimbriiglobus ruber TaxID=1908690 RepID=A0A225D9U2_9BACT|nr:PEP-CTERM sorting domain-containing protein [Fimbriiglobus ruber]OWK38380.1 hypothetical protein FRUB_07500 [Fimbriiglobus ruber]
MKTRLLLLAPVVAAGFVLAGPTVGARAGLLPVSWSVTSEAGDYRWTYAIVLPTDSQLQTGNYFTIYDFAGFVPGTNSQPAGWTFSSANVGPTPTGVAPTDNPTLPNLTWTYTGPTTTVGQVGLGNFWAVSLYQDETTSDFAARTNRVSDGQIDTNITSTSVPVPSANGGGEGVPGAPEPATLALAGLGLPLIGLARLFRRKR